MTQQLLSNRFKLDFLLSKVFVIFFLPVIVLYTYKNKIQIFISRTLKVSLNQIHHSCDFSSPLRQGNNREQWRNEGDNYWHAWIYYILFSRGSLGECTQCCSNCDVMCVPFTVSELPEKAFFLVQEEHIKMESFQKLIQQIDNLVTSITLIIHLILLTLTYDRQKIIFENYSKNTVEHKVSSDSIQGTGNWSIYTLLPIWSVAV